MLDHTLELELDLNERHLIIGDLHGRYDELMRLLDKANYDPAKDIIYSVGDIIDRGPCSWEIIEFFEGERRYAIKGNHELMCLDREWADVWLANGGEQFLESIAFCGVGYEQAKDVIRKWPWVIDVGAPDEEFSFRIVHAEMPPEWSDEFFKRVLDESLNHNDTTFAHLVWSRRLIDTAKRNVANMRPAHIGINFHPDRRRQVFAGHTPHKNILKVGDHWFLDTWTGRKQSMIDAVTLEKFTVDFTS